MSYIVKAGTPYLRYTDPQVTGAANPRGLYPWSAFYAPLATYATGTVDADSTLAGETVYLLLFTADIPVISRAVVTDANTGQTNTQAVVNEGGLPVAFVTDTSGGGGAVTTTNYGEVLKGYSGAALAVAVSGFAAVIRGRVVAPLGTTVTAGVVEAGDASSVAIECIANSGSVAGVVGPNFPGTVGFGKANAPTPIIVAAGAYTQTIKDNDNLIESSGGLLYQVVGLYYIVP